MMLHIFESDQLVDVEVLRDETRTPCPDPEVRIALMGPARCNVPDARDSGSLCVGETIDREK